MTEEIFSDTKKYSINDITVEVCSDIIDEKLNTVVIIDDSVYYHCGDMPANLDTVKQAFCNYFKVDLTQEQIEGIKNLNESIQQMP